MKTPTTASSSIWGPSDNGLRQYVPTGVWHIRHRVGKRWLTESTKTTDKREARKIFHRRVGEESVKPEPSVSAEAAQATFADVLQIFRNRCAHRISAGDLSKKTLDRFNWTLASIEKSWTGKPFLDCRPADVNYDDLLAWQARFSQHYSADYTNKAVALIRDWFEIAIEKKWAETPSPATRLNWLVVTRTKAELPTREQFKRILETILADKCNRYKQDIFNLVKGLALSGLRIEEARLLRTQHLNLEAGTLDLPAEIVKGRETPRQVHLTAAGKEHFAKLVSQAGNDCHVFKVSECQRTLTKACKTAGAPRLTHHKLRHLFATWCLEGGAPVNIVAGWLGHRDGGALLLRTYAHLINDAGQKAAARLNLA